MDTITKPDEQAPTDHFERAKMGFWLFGHLLNAYSVSRKIAAQSMGMLYPYIGDAGAKQLDQTGIYSGVLKDVIICLWLCTLKDSVDLTLDEVKAGAWTPSRAIHSPAQALDAACAWAEHNSVADIDSGSFKEALQVFMAIVTGASCSEFTLQVDGVTLVDEVQQDSGSPKV